MRKASSRIPIVLTVAITLSALGAAPAYAAYQEGGKVCRSGASGTVCAHVEFDTATGNIRGRGAADANQPPGNVIELTVTTLEIQITERSTHQVTEQAFAIGYGPVRTSNPVVSLIAGPKVEPCDNALRTVAFKATANYKVYSGSSVASYAVATDWVPGRC